MSRQLEKLAENNPDIIESISIETSTDDGYWLYLHHDYICPDMECGTIHEYTVKGCLEMFKTVRKRTTEERTE